jgi:hypothetical protein
MLSETVITDSYDCFKLQLCAFYKVFRDPWAGAITLFTTVNITKEVRYGFPSEFCLNLNFAQRTLAYWH